MENGAAHKAASGQPEAAPAPGFGAQLIARFHICVAWGVKRNHNGNFMISRKVPLEGSGMPADGSHPFRDECSLERSPPGPKRV